MDNTWEAKKYSKSMGRIVNNDTEMVFGNFRFNPVAADQDNIKFFEDIESAYYDYFKKERKKRMLHPEILTSNRVLVISDLESERSFAEFKLKKNEDIVKDFQLVVKILNSYENYLRSMRLRMEED